MGEFQLVQAVEEKVFRNVSSKKDSSEKDKSLTELVSDENKEKARKHFWNSFEFENYELNPIYDNIMGYLLQDIVFSEEKLIPDRVINPQDTDKKFLDLYSVLAQVDFYFKDYKEFIRQNKSTESNIESKLNSAENRLKTVQERLEDAESEHKSLDNGEINHDVARLKVEIEKYRTEESDIKEQITRHKKRLKFLDKELKNFIADSPLKSYFDAAFSIANELDLESDLSFEIPETGKVVGPTSDITLLQRKIQGVNIELDPFTKPKEDTPSFLNKWKYAICAGAALLGLAGVLVYNALKPKTITVEAPIVKFDPQTMDIWTKVPGIKEPVKSKLASTLVYIPSEKYLPGAIEIVNFDAKTNDIVFRNTKCENEELTKNLGENFDLRKKGIFIRDYLQKGKDKFNIFERVRVYGLDHEGDFGLVNGLPNNPSERYVSKREIVDHLKGIASNYKTYSVAEANIMIKGYKIVDAKYEQSKHLLTLITEGNVFDIPLHLHNRVFLSSNDYDNIPDALMHPSKDMIYFDLSRDSEEVICIKEGERFNNITHFFPVLNITPKF